MPRELWIAWPCLASMRLWQHQVAASVKERLLPDGATAHRQSPATAGRPCQPCTRLPTCFQEPFCRMKPVAAVPSTPASTPAVLLSPRSTPA